jgi:hypothetical protein
MVVDRDLPLIVPKTADEVGGSSHGFQFSRALRRYWSTHKHEMLRQLNNACGYVWRCQVGELCIPLLRLNVLQLDLIARVVEATREAAHTKNGVKPAGDDKVLAGGDKVFTPNEVSKQKITMKDE